jgi:hypothetical protein
MIPATEFASAQAEPASITRSAAQTETTFNLIFKSSSCFKFYCNYKPLPIISIARSNYLVAYFHSEIYPKHLLYQQVFKETDVKRRASLRCADEDI